MKKNNFFKNVQREFKQIVWPKKEEVTKKTALVIVLSFVLTLLIFGLDTLFGFGVNELLTKLM